MAGLMGRWKAIVKSGFMNQEVCVAYPLISKALFSHAHSICLDHHLIMSLSEAFNSYSLVPKENSRFSSCHSRSSPSDPKLSVLWCGTSIWYATVLLIFLHIRVLFLFFSLHGTAVVNHLCLFFWVLLNYHIILETFPSHHNAEFFLFLNSCIFLFCIILFH